MRAEWRSALAMSGALCVMVVGAVLMLLWCVDNWDTPLKVRNILRINSSTRQFCKLERNIHVALNSSLSYNIAKNNYIHFVRNSTVTSSCKK